jgi:hypothetical protein
MNNETLHVVVIISILFLMAIAVTILGGVMIQARWLEAGGVFVAFGVACACYAVWRILDMIKS